MVSGIDLLNEKIGKSGADLLSDDAKAPTTSAPARSFSSGMDLLDSVEQKTAEPKTFEVPEYEEATKIAEEQEAARQFYGSAGIAPPFQGSVPGVWSPALAAKMGQWGYGPKPPGGWSEAGVPLDENGEPYTLTDPAEGAPDWAKGVRDIMAETFSGMVSFATHPYETAIGAADFALSIPGFLVGLGAGAANAGREMIRQTAMADEDAINPAFPFGLDISKIYDLEDMYFEFSKGMTESMEFFQPGKEAILGEPTEQTHKVAEVAMAPFTLLSKLGI